jgi:PhnB protein
MALKSMPAGYHTIVPSFTVDDGEAAIRFLQQAFGAKLRHRFDAPDGTLAHCEMEIGDSVVMFGNPMGDSGEHKLSAMIYVDDCDQTFQKAISAGGRSKQAPQNQFWGDRTGRVVDPFGNEWYLATHVEDVSTDEMKRRFDAMMAQQAQAAE